MWPLAFKTRSYDFPATGQSFSTAVTIITYEEQLRGRLSVLSRAKNLDKQVVAYQWLKKLSENYRSIQIIPFDRVAGVEYQRLRKAYPRLGAMDLRIAAISIVLQFLLRRMQFFSPETHQISVKSKSCQ